MPKIKPAPLSKQLRAKIRRAVEWRGSSYLTDGSCLALVKLLATELPFRLMSRELGLSSPYLCRLANGKRSRPSWHATALLAAWVIRRRLNRPRRNPK